MRYLVAGVLVALALAALWLVLGRGAGGGGRDDGADVQALYAAPRPLPQGPLRVYHLGHSLVGRDMPAMLAELAGAGHDYALQLGWGTALSEHWQGPEAINGFQAENATPRYRDAGQALDSGDYDAFVMTEMVRLKDAIAYKDSRKAVAQWAARAAAGNPDGQIFLYETWHALDDQPEWLSRLPLDLETQWKPDLLWPAARAAGRPVWLIPAGQVMAAVVAEAEAKGIAELTRREQLFGRDAEGALDPIHPGDLGLYLVALTHYAVLYGRSPVGLPAQLHHADGSPAQAPSPELARRMQEIVWEVVRANALTGVRAP
ncbi:MULTISPECIES: hypothetical protein [unclassified Paracoccus (in: a-proteobacteria)]|uniref:hypothetical protein n=1 Tax=unclassified Paracoccus (in: a-proteobacteria) TaxID=2688777 RepID=UPI001354C698|nr:MULTISPECIES: hypothetical protein [unclassified Paracoccus (in: a-proteobacteria)]UXU75637.1 hypothetical protein GB879_003850 [Paracoccus sp. SMMA_5]UXU81542.1 hypothetical protein GB880_003840 [Paracoccus sp. SMMA_5_TC]